MILRYLLFAALLLVVAYGVFRILLRRDYAEHRRLSRFSTLMEFVVFLLHANFSYLFVPAIWPALPALSGNTLLNALGFILIAIGLGIVITGMTRLGFPGTLGGHARSLQQSGLYSLSRNPQIIGYGLVVLGYAVFWPSWYALGWVLLYAVIAHWMVQSEEEYLLALHGDSYRRYCEQVPRYLGPSKRPLGS